jgi:probable F420-dependent oxidoreductase
MKVDRGIGPDVTAAGALARDAEAAGYDGIWSAEISHDPFLPLILAADATERLEVGTNIAVAFARSPMTMANIANDLQLLSKGRFNLGVGSQIKPHIEKRFSMPWSHPAPRMREFILAMRAIWDAWNTDGTLDFRGDFYSHTLMTPMFNPGPNPYGPPKVFLAGVGKHMTEMAGEVADGVLIHALTTERYVREVTLPTVERGLAKSGRSRADIELVYPAFVVTGDTEDAMDSAARAVRRQIAFYASTPAYRPVLEVHGWGELQTELNALSKRGEWAEMGERIDDEVLNAFAVVSEPDSLPRLLRERFDGPIDRVLAAVPYTGDRLKHFLAEFRAT